MNCPPTIVSKEFKNVDDVGPYYCCEKDRYNNIIGEWWFEKFNIKYFYELPIFFKSHFNSIDAVGPFVVVKKYIIILKVAQCSMNVNAQVYFKVFF